MKKCFSFIALLLTLLLFSFLLIMGGEEKASPVKSSAPLSPSGLITSQELPLLSAHFGLSVPYCSLTGSGKVEDVNYQGNYARLFTWTDENGLTVTSVRPAAAAHLLRDDALSPFTQSTYLIDDMTAALYTGNSISTLHFGDSDAAYCLTYPGSAEELFSLLNSLQFTN